MNSLKPRDRALRHLSTLMQSGQATSDRLRLPTISQLAQDSQVSYQTMWKAVQVFQQQGLLESLPGKGTIVTGAAAAASYLEYPHPQPATSLSFHTAAQKICADIERGQFAFGNRLPSTKELSARYGVCLKTMRRALDQLVHSGWIIRHQRSYRVYSVNRETTPNQRVFLFCRGLEQGQILDITPRTTFLLRQLEDECGRNNVRLCTVPLYYHESSIHNINQVLKLIESPDNTAGFVFWTAAIPPAVALEVLLGLNAQSRPAAILDEGGLGTIQAARTWKRHIRWYLMGQGRTEGRIVARFLIEQGHRSIAYIGYRSDTPTCVNRRYGFKETFTQAGCPHHIQYHNIPGPESFQTAGSSPAEIDNSIKRVVQDVFGQEHALQQRGLGTRFSEYVYLEVSRVRELSAIRAGLFALLEQIFAAGSVNAIAAYNDTIALGCLDFCYEHSIAVPRAVSIIGFDDGRDAHLFKMSSYNFNTAAYSHSMIRHILDAPAALPGATSGPPSEFAGYVTERDTTLFLPRAAEP